VTLSSLTVQWLREFCSVPLIDHHFNFTFHTQASGSAYRSIMTMKSPIRGAAPLSASHISRITSTMSESSNAHLWRNSQVDAIVLGNFQIHRVVRSDAFENLIIT